MSLDHRRQVQAKDGHDVMHSIVVISTCLQVAIEGHHSTEVSTVGTG
jgi:hypothetical protein